ncbi:MAG: hypothetical protein R3D66_02490 [Alphaproteobacteria bacterium]
MTAHSMTGHLMTGHTPLELYRGRVADGEIAPDPGQDEAAQRWIRYIGLFWISRLAVCTKRRMPQWLQNIAGKENQPPGKTKLSEAFIFMAESVAGNPC